MLRVNSQQRFASGPGFFLLSGAYLQGVESFGVKGSSLRAVKGH